MIKNLDKEEKFYANKNFAFSYSSLNKLLFSPWLFYKDYILQDRDIKTDKHLVEGKLVHCLVFEPENLTKKFNNTDLFLKVSNLLDEGYQRPHGYNQDGRILKFGVKY